MAWKTRTAIKGSKDSAGYHRYEWVTQEEIGLVVDEVIRQFESELRISTADSSTGPSRDSSRNANTVRIVNGFLVNGWTSGPLTAATTWGDGKSFPNEAGITNAAYRYVCVRTDRA